MLWLVGRWEGDDGWKLIGLFNSRQKAIDNCTRDNDFVMDNIELNKHLGDIVTHDAYYPKLGQTCTADNLKALEKEHVQGEPCVCCNGEDYFIDTPEGFVLDICPVCHKKRN